MAHRVDYQDNDRCAQSDQQNAREHLSRFFGLQGPKDGGAYLPVNPDRQGGNIFIKGLQYGAACLQKRCPFVNRPLNRLLVGKWNGGLKSDTHLFYFSRINALQAGVCLLQQRFVALCKRNPLHACRNTP